jgi:hypothetical protein
MKQITVFLLLVLLAAQCYPQKKKMTKESVTSIEFEMFGRRGKTEISISKQFAISTSRSEKKFIPMTVVQWNELLGTVNKLNLASIGKLTAPTKRREVDGALHCRIFISTKNKKYETQYFDSGIPMKELKPLYDKIEAIRFAINDGGETWKDE